MSRRYRRLAVLGALGVSLGLCGCQSSPSSGQASDASSPGYEAAASDGTSESFLEAASDAPNVATEGSADLTVDVVGDSSVEAAIDAADGGESLAAGCVSAAIGPGGGTVVHPRGATIIVPHGALAAATQLSICPESVTVPAAVGEAFEFSPEGQVFLVPVQIILPFEPTRLGVGADVSQIQVHAAPHGSATFVPLQSSVRLATSLVQSSTTHFTQFVAAQTPSPLFITTPSALASGTVGIPYTQQFTATGGTTPYSWSVPSSTALPPGLSLTGAGLLAGSPTIPNNYAFFVQVSDSANDSVAMAVSLTINPPNNPVPSLSQIAPSSAPQGNGDLVITLSGSGFAPGAIVLWEGSPLATTFVGPTELTASIPAADLLVVGSNPVVVSNPVPGGGTSGSIPFTVTPSNLNPLPSISSVSPTQLPVSSVNVQVSIDGSNFVASSSAVVGSQPITTSYLSATQLFAAIPAAFLSAAGTLRIGVSNPAPGGGLSPTTITVTVGTLNPLPTLVKLSPPSVGAGSGPFTLTLSGSGFVPGAQVFLGSTAAATTFVSTTSVQAQVPAYLVTTPAAVQVTLVNPTPGGGASGALSLDVLSEAGTTCALTLCGALCVDTSTDSNNCGGCGVVCSASGPTGSFCQKGSCTCPGSEVVCSGACKDPSSDVNNCGGCNVACSTVSPSTTSCALGRCLVTLAAAQNGPYDLAVDATSVYWSGVYYAGPSVIAKIPLAGGTVTTLLSGLPSDNTGPLQQPGHIAIDATNVYWTNVRGPITSGTVCKMPLGGGAVTTLASGLGDIYGIVVDSTNAYWADQVAGTLASVPLLGGIPMTIASGQNRPFGIAVDATSIYWVDTANSVTGQAAGLVMKAPIGGVPDGGAPTVLASGQNLPIDIAVDKDSIYWTNGGSVREGSVMKMPLGGGTITTLATGGHPTRIAIDGASVYWTDSSLGPVMKVPLGGGPTTLLATAISPFGIKVDATSVYFVAYGSGTNAGSVMKVTPK